MYSPYNIGVANNDYTPYRVENTTNTGYNVPTYNANSVTDD